MKNFRELPTAIIGSLGEAAASEALRSDGASIIALCQIDSGGAPMLERGLVRRDHAVLPDLQVFNSPIAPGAFFVEIKTYAESREFRKHGIWIHGIPVRLYDHYVTKNTTGLPVYLGINELNTGTLRISSVPLIELTKYACMCKGRCESTNARAHVPSGRGIREMQWYFDREDLSIVYKHSDKTIERLRREHSARIGSHAWQRHGARDQQPEPRRVSEDVFFSLRTKPRNQCDRCERIAAITLLCEDSKGQRILCSSCWKELHEHTQSAARRSVA